MFEATKRKFNDIQFQVLDYDKELDLKSKYGVESIPRLIYLDANGTVLRNGGAWANEESFTNSIMDFR